MSEIVHTAGPWNARRIVACVNACADASNLFLEAVASAGGITQMEAEKHRYMVERAELLSSLKELVAWHGKRGGEKDELLPTDAQEAEIQRAMLVIAKAEAKP